MYVTADLPKVNHPKFDGYTNLGDNVIALFRFGCVEIPPAEAKEAMGRIRAAVAGLAGDLATVQPWGGRIAVYGLEPESINPEISDADIHACEAAALAAIPGAQRLRSWRNSSNGLDGVSVLLKL